MWLSLILIALILAIALFQSTQGLFSALIMAVLTICCAAAAMGWHEWVAIHWLASWKPDYAMPIALGVTFGVPLLVLRLAADNLIRRSGLLPSWVDRAGGGICGLITALITVGVLANCLLAVPFGDSVLGFARVDNPSMEKKDDGPDPVPPDANVAIRELLLTPDRFAYGVTAMLSDGLFSGSRSLRQENPDWTEAHAWANSAGPGVSRLAPTASISIVRTEPLQFVYREVTDRNARRNEDPSTYESVVPKVGNGFRMIRVNIQPGRGKDASRHLSFTLRQFRLVGRPQPGAPLEQYHAIAIQQPRTDAGGSVNRHIRFHKTRWGDWPVTDETYSPMSGENNEVEIVFELPKSFVPSFLEYKQTARAAVSFDAPAPKGRETPETPPPASEPTPSGTTGETAPNSGLGGNVRRFTTRTGQSFFGDALPMTLKSYRQLKNVELKGNALVDGHLVANVDEQETGTHNPVSRLEVPTDKRLLQLNTGYLQARSTLGRAMSFAVGTLQNYTVEDANGTRYEVAGKCAVADVDGRQVIEVQYFSNRAGTVGQLGPFERISESHLKGDYELIFLFLVDPGVQITAFNTGGAANRKDDLREENLVAPQ